ncbi:MAG: copper chaperone PCu(A)C [Sulfitobacter sp.]
MISAKYFAAGAAALMLTSTMLLAGDIAVQDPYMRSSTPSSVSGAAFLMLMNKGTQDDVLISASTDIAARVELHRHSEDDDGVMRMGEIEGGIALPAGEMHHLKRGGDHIMLMGLTRPLVQGEEITVTLTFEKAGDVLVQIPVDRDRKPSHDHETKAHSHDG